MSMDSRKTYVFLTCIALAVIFSIAFLKVDSRPNNSFLANKNFSGNVKNSESSPELVETAAQRVITSATGSSRKDSTLTISFVLEQRFLQLEDDYKLPGDLRKFFGSSGSAAMRKELRARINSHLSEKLTISELRSLAQLVQFPASSLELLERAHLNQNYSSSKGEIEDISKSFESFSLNQLGSQSDIAGGATHHNVGQVSQVIEADSAAHLLNEVSKDFSFSFAHFLSTQYLSL